MTAYQRTWAWDGLRATFVPEHPARYPLWTGGQWLHTCTCHWMRPVLPVVAK